MGAGRLGRGVVNEATFSSLVSDFYRAATGALGWDSALDGVCTAFGARVVGLQKLDSINGRLITLDCGGPAVEELLLAYIRDYHRIDPRRSHVLQLGADGLDRWHHDDDDLDDGLVRRGRFYQHWQTAYAMRHNAAILFQIDGSTAVAFVLELHANRGPLDPDERVWVERLGRHVRDALRAHERVRALMAQALAGHRLLGSFAYPMWLIDADRDVVYANPAAAQEVAAATRVAQRGQQLALVRDRADRDLSERLHTLVRAAHGSSTAVDLRATASDPPVWLHLSLLVPGKVLGAFGDRPQVLATLFDPAHVSPLDTFALGNLFGLTPTEARVASHLADGLTAAQIGALHGSGVPTVRSQIAQVVHKLGAQRAVDVVRVLRQGEALWSSVGKSG